MIAISATGNKVRDLMDIRFARCPMFLIIDGDGKKYLTNPYTDAESDVAPKVIKWLMDLGVSKIITGEVGQKAKNILEEHKIQVVLMDVEKISMQNLLKKLNL